MSVPLFTYYFYSKVCLRLSEICLKEDMVGRTYCDWQHQKSGGLPFNKPSPPQTGWAIGFVCRADSTAFYSPSFCRFSCCFSPNLTIAHPTSRVNKTHMEAIRVKLARRDGFTPKKTLNPKHARPFILETKHLWLNCNTFTAAIAMNGLCIMGHPSIEETHKA